MAEGTSFRMIPPVQVLDNVAGVHGKNLVSLKNYSQTGITLYRYIETLW